MKVPDAPLDNISFHSVDNVERWRYVYLRRVAGERGLGKDALKIKEVMKMISNAGLMRTVSGIAKCYDILVKEFIVNIPRDVADPRNSNFRKVFVRGRCVDFSPAIINCYLGKREDDVCEMEVTDNQVCKELTANQVKVWPLKGKWSAGLLSVKYAILHRIGAAN